MRQHVSNPFEAGLLIPRSRFFRQCLVVAQEFQTPLKRGC